MKLFFILEVCEIMSGVVSAIRNVGAVVIFMNRLLREKLDNCLFFVLLTLNSPIIIAYLYSEALVKMFFFSIVDHCVYIPRKQEVFLLHMIKRNQDFIV